MAPFLKRIWTAKIGHWFWALTDQGVVSLGTFLTSIILARAMPPAEYGLFALICGTFNFLNSLHSALVIIPCISRCASAEPDEIRRVASGSMILTFLLVLPLGVVVGLACWIGGRPHLAFYASLALVLWQFQETIRRTFMIRLGHREAASGDTLRYLGQAALVWFCTSRWQLSIEGALIIMSAASAVAGLVQVIQHGLKWMRLAEIPRLAEVYWRLGRWILMTNFVSLFLSQAYPFVLVLFYNTAVSAEFQAVGNILGITHPVAFGIGSLIYPVVARAKGKSGEGEAARVGLGYGIQGGMLLLPFYLILVLRPEWALKLFYGAGSPYLGLAGMLRLFVIFYLIDYTANIMVAVLNSLERTRAAFFSQLTSATTTIVIGLPLTAWRGLIGAIIACSLTSLARLMVSGVYLRQIRAIGKTSYFKIAKFAKNRPVESVSE